jgi:hypothetical protein
MDIRFDLEFIFFIELGESVWDTEAHLFSKVSYTCSLNEKKKKLTLYISQKPFFSSYGPITCGERIYYPYATEGFTCWKEFDKCQFFSVNASLS